MQTLMIYMSDSMHTHEMSVHITKCSPHLTQEEIVLNMESYRRHFQKKATGKVHMTVLETNDVTGVITQTYNELLVWPIKEKIVINKRVTSVGTEPQATQFNWEFMTATQILGSAS